MRRTLAVSRYDAYQRLFDKHVSAIMLRAQTLAEHHQNGELNTSHVLMAALETDEFVQLLGRLDLTLEQVAELKNRLAPHLARTTRYFEAGEPFQLSHDCGQAIAHALQESNRTCQVTIQMAHLLFGLAGTQADPAGCGLQSFEVNSDRVRRRIDADRKDARSSVRRGKVGSRQSESAHSALLHQLTQQVRELSERVSRLETQAAGVVTTTESHQPARSRI